MTENLNGLGVLITRPVAQATRLAQNIRSAGGEPLVYPTIAITDTENPRAAQEIFAALADFDWAIFISANAVEKTFSLFAPQAWPATLATAAIGAATAQALRQRGVKNILAPTESFDSESLLALAEFQSVKNSRIVIFRGQGGRETLKQTFTARGAEVTYCETYSRIKPTVSNQALHLWLEQKKIHVIDVMSAESLANLLELAGDTTLALKKIPLITHHPRVAQVARDAGFNQVITCPPEDTAFMSVLESLSLGKLA